LWFAFNWPSISCKLVGVIFGLTLDYFTKTPGLHAAPCTLIAYMRPFLVNILIRQEGAEQNYSSPSITSMGLAPYATYVFILTLIHNGYLVFLEWIEFGSFFYFAGKVLASTGVSMLLIFVTEILFFRKEKFRTNTA
jgi:hypothetical protein